MTDTVATTDSPRVGVLGGTGDQGRGLARRLAMSGLTVVVGSRDEARAQASAEGLGHGVAGATNAECAATSDIVIAAVPYDGHAELLASLREQLVGKILIDCVNPLGFDKQGAFVLPVPEGSAAQQAQALLPETTVVGAFHTVSAKLLLDTDAPDHKAETMGVLVDWPGEAAWPVKFVFLASESHPPSCAVATLAAERVERQREELNALYVALTRARANLVLSSIEPHRRTGRSWWQRLLETELVPRLGIDVAAVSAGSGSGSGGADLEIRTLPSAPPGQSSSPFVAELESRERRIGKAMHRMLEWGRVYEPNTLAAAREFQLTPQQGAAAAAMAERILQGDAAWAWDAAVVAWSGNEVEMQFEGQLLRMDRLLQRRDNGHWWVLDYKSAGAPQEDPQLRSQLCSYRKALRSIYPDAIVRAAFLTAQGRFIELEEGA